MNSFIPTSNDYQNNISDETQTSCISGGTVDTTGHEVLPDGTLKELHAATGGPWGGQLVNEAFEKFIEKMVS
jgi:hypothetical protein